MKNIYSLTIALSLCLTSFTNADGKNAIMMDKVEDPLAGMVSTMGEKHVKEARKMMGHKGDITEYKHCIQNINFKGFKYMYEDMKKEASEDNQYNDIKKISLVEKCPLPANGSCDHGTRIEYFYTSSSTLLEDQKEGCTYSEENKWITFASTAGDVKEDTKALALITVEGKEYRFETDNNCISIMGTPVSTPVFNNEQFSFALHQRGRDKDNWDINYMLPIVGSPGRMDLYKSKKYQVNYDEKTIKGSAKMFKSNDIKKTVDVAFKINCL